MKRRRNEAVLSSPLQTRSMGRTLLRVVTLSSLFCAHLLPAVQAQEDSSSDNNSSSNTTLTAPSPAPSIDRNAPAPTQQGPVSGQASCGGLDCQHNSTCRQGNTTFGVDSDVGFHMVTNHNGFYCQCPDGFAGLDCGRPYQTCSDLRDSKNNYINPKCYHGGVCLSQNQVEEKQFAAYCECSKAFYDGQQYTGKYCELLVTESEYCPYQPDLFCINGGSCPNRDAPATSTCACPQGYFGDHCEYVAPQGPECTLECFNEGTCRVGRTKSVWGNQDDFFCQCTRGYGGVQCEHLAETCDDGTVCLHGATCEREALSDSYYCACHETYLGGSGCRQKQSMELCMPTLGPEYSLSMAVPAFCLNGGTCRDVLNANTLVDFVCDCPPLFEGPHCEFLKTAREIGDIDDLINPSQSREGPGFVAGYAALIAIGVVGIMFVVRQVRRIRKSRRREKDVVLNLQSAREENFGAISANGSMLFPGISPPPSTFSDSNGSNFATGELMHDVDLT